MDVTAGLSDSLRATKERAKHRTPDRRLDPSERLAGWVGRIAQSPSTPFLLPKNPRYGFWTQCILLAFVGISHGLSLQNRV